MSEPPIAPARAPGARAAFGATLLVAIVVILGGQLLRITLPMIGWYLRDTVGVPILGLLPYAVAPFIVGFTAPLLIRLLRPRGALVISGLGLAAVRIVEQVSASPQVQLWVGMAGIALFIWMLGIVATRSRQATVLGVMLGLALDGALRALTGTVEPSWAPGLWPTVVVIALAAGLVLLVLAAASPRKVAAERGAWIGLPGGHRPRMAVSLAAIGPFLLLHWLVLQNQGWLTTQTGWDWPAVVALMAVGNLLALVGAAWLLPSAQEGPVAAVMGMVLLVVAGLATQTGWLFAVVVLLGLVASGPYLATVVPPPDPTRPAGVATTLAVAAGALVMVLVTFVYYATLDLALPFGQGEVRIALGVLLALLALGAADIPAAGIARDWRPALLGVVLLAAPPALLVLHPLPEAPGSGDGLPVTVMTYNLHSGYAVDGTHSLEAIAQAIEESGADVVGLQEASRGWLMDASHDAVMWLARRLGMPHVAFHAPGDDPLWGNAILSRYPLEEVEVDTMPRQGTLVHRGYLRARVDLGQSDHIDLFVTHLQHEADDLTALHAAQIDVILEAWDEAPRTVLIGDLNAEVDEPQMASLLEEGFVDAWEQGEGEGEGATWRADDPDVRIDYLLHTEDLATRSVQVPATAASDHRPVVASIDLAE